MDPCNRTLYPLPYRTRCIFVHGLNVFALLSVFSPPALTIGVIRVVPVVLETTGALMSVQSVRTAVGITGFTMFNKSVAIGAHSVLEKTIPYFGFPDSFPTQNNVFSFEFAALSYANVGTNRYRLKLEN